MATSVERLHYDNSTFNWTHSLDENGNQFASRIDGDPDFTEHDVLTGTRIDGTAFPEGEDRTCGNWTSNGDGSPPCWATPTATPSRRRARPGTPPTRHAVAHRTIWWRPQRSPKYSSGDWSADVGRSSSVGSSGGTAHESARWRPGI